jgi:hypothetical protein
MDRLDGESSVTATTLFEVRPAGLPVRRLLMRQNGSSGEREENEEVSCARSVKKIVQTDGGTRGRSGYLSSSCRKLRSHEGVPTITVREKRGSNSACHTDAELI